MRIISSLFSPSILIRYESRQETEKCRIVTAIYILEASPRAFRANDTALSASCISRRAKSTLPSSRSHGRLRSCHFLLSQRFKQNLLDDGFGKYHNWKSGERRTKREQQNKKHEDETAGGEAKKTLRLNYKYERYCR